MIFAKNDEEKRSKVWRIVTTITTILIIVIAVFFITKLFTSNPLEGTWIHKDSGMELNITGNNLLTVKWADLLENTNVKIKMNYTLDKEDKTITIKVDESEVKKVVNNSEGDINASSLKSALSSIATTFNYSVEHHKLVLIEREYGDQMVFEKK
ncbi:MAG: hypothetical protein RSA90_00765 [Lachnospiraceae bacterium]